MDDFQKRFCEMTMQYPDSMNDRKKLKAVLTDFFPEQKREVNIVLTSFDSDLLEKLEQGGDITLNALRSIKALVDEFGLTDTHAKWAVQTWCYSLGYTEIAEALKIVSATPLVEATPAQQKPMETKQEFVLGTGTYRVDFDFPAGIYSAETLVNYDSACNIYNQANEQGYGGSLGITSKTYITVKKGQYLKITRGKVQLTLLPE